MLSPANSGFNLTVARLNRGLSTRQAAELIGVNQQTVERAEAGVRIWPAKAKLIADFYGVNVSDFYGIPAEAA